MNNLSRTAAAALILVLSGGVSVAQMNSTTGSTASGSSTNAACPDESAFKGAKNDGISSAERQNVRTTVFDELDKNKDGSVSRAEYVDCLVQTPAFKEKGNGAAAVKK